MAHSNMINRDSHQLKSITKVISTTGTVMKVVASYLTKPEAKSFSRAFPKAQICLMDSKSCYKDRRESVINKPFWCVQT